MVCLISARTSRHFPCLSPLPCAMSRMRVRGTDCVNSAVNAGSLGCRRRIRARHSSAKRPPALDALRSIASMDSYIFCEALAWWLGR